MKINYRPEIDGLRAIAVVSVVLYHAQLSIFGIKPFQGGYIGVDIFFVISGYLITSIILKELFTKGTLSLKLFYERRVRRILPALLLVMLTSLPFAWLLFLPNTFIDFSKSILYSLGFTSNLYFHYTGQEYGAVSGLLKPFLHTWSLSVEEQFYILFPTFLLIIFKFFRKYIVPILLVGFTVSLLFADWGSKNYPSFNFYVLPTRGWQLLAGSLLAYYEINLGHRSKNQKLNLILPIIGLFLILHSIVFFDDKIFHPSLFTLSPVIGVCLIIWFSQKNEITTKILSTKLFVGIGLISYSLYLWHYPIFAFARITEFTQGNILKKFLLGVIILILSILSYYYVERPARNKKNSFKNISIVLILTGLIISIFNFTVIYKDGFREKYTDIYFKNNIFNEILKEDSWKFVNNQNIQKFKNTEKLNILIVGDSLSKDLFNVFIQNQDLFKNYEFLRYGNNGNTDALTFDDNYSEKRVKVFEESEVYSQSDFILISEYFNSNESLDRLENFINIFKNRKKIILTSLPNIYKDDYRHEKLYNLTLFDYFLIRNSDTLYHIDQNLGKNTINLINKEYFENREINKVNKTNKKLETISSKYNIRLIYKQDYQCNFINQICHGITDKGFKIHYDNLHYTLEGAKFFGKKIFEINWLNF